MGSMATAPSINNFYIVADLWRSKNGSDQRKKLTYLSFKTCPNRLCRVWYQSKATAN
jgi:hypothetical protein